MASEEVRRALLRKMEGLDDDYYYKGEEDRKKLAQFSDMERNDILL